MQQPLPSSQINLFSTALPTKPSCHTPSKQVPLISYQDFEQLSGRGLHSDQQETQRIRHKQSLQFGCISPTYSEAELSEGNEGEGIESSLIELTNEIDLQRATICKANQLVQYLREQNQRLNEKLQYTLEQMDLMRSQYEARLSQSSNLIRQLEGNYRTETACSSFMQGRPQNITPLKVYTRGQEGVRVYLPGAEAAQFQQLLNMEIKQSLDELHHKFAVLTEFQQEEAEKVQIKQNEAKYLQAYVQDQLLSTESPLFSTHDYSTADHPQQLAILIQDYQQLVLGLQDYASSLKKQLVDCMVHLSHLTASTPSQPALSARQYSSEDLVGYIRKQIAGQVQGKVRALAAENAELKQILEQLCSKIKASSARRDC